MQIKGQNTVSVRLIMSLSYFSVILIIIIIISLFSYRSTAQTIWDKENINTQKITEIVNTRLLNIFTSVDTVRYILNMKSYQDNLRELEKQAVNSVEYNNIKESLFSSLSVYLWQAGILRFARHTALIRPSGHIVSSMYYGPIPPDSLLQSSIYKNAIAKGGQMHYQYADTEYLLSENLGAPIKPVLLMACRVPDLKYGGTFGVFILSLDWENICNILDSLASGSAESGYALIDAEGKVLHASGVDEALVTALAGEARENGGKPDLLSLDSPKYIVTAQAISAPQWRFLYITPKSALYGDIRRIRNLTAALSLIAFAASALISALFLNSLYKPVRQIRSFTSEARRGNFFNKLSYGMFKEYNALIAALNDLLEEHAALIRQNFELSVHEKEAALVALRAQINPHFLFNALGAISCGAMLGKTEEIRGVADALADLLRYNLGGWNTGERQISPYISNHFSTIREELKSIESYIKIQQLRFGKNLYVEINAEDVIMDMRINRFILQPIVENSFVHGLDKIDNEKKLAVCGYLAGQNIILSVSDNGAGMPEEKAAAISRFLRDCKDSDTQEGENSILDSIGLANVNKRIQLAFGKQYGVNFSSKQGAGTTVTITVPAGNA